jgi:hypothetical protein
MCRMLSTEKLGWLSSRTVNLSPLEKQFELRGLNSLQHTEPPQLPPPAAQHSRETGSSNGEQSHKNKDP